MWERPVAQNLGRSVFPGRSSRSRLWGHTLSPSSSHFSFQAKSSPPLTSAGFSTLRFCGRKGEGTWAVWGLGSETGHSQAGALSGHSPSGLGTLASPEEAP